MTKLNYIDLFAGAGGLSEGFIRQGFTPVAHVESDAASCFTLKTRAAYHWLSATGNLALYYSYLKGEISRKELYSNGSSTVLDSVINAEIGNENETIFEKIDRLLGNREIDLIIGGPPCQAYSSIGRSVLKNKTDDVRRTLYIQYGRFLNRYRPKVFVFENVPGLLVSYGGKYFKNLRKYFRRLGYAVEAKILNAYDYGVVQHRERVIIIGWQRDMDFRYPEIPVINAKYTRDDIFTDLPPVTPGDNRKFHLYHKPVNLYLAESGIRNGVDFVTQHNTRVHNAKDLAIYKLAIETLSAGEHLKNNQVPEPIRTQNNVTDFLDRFKVVDVQPHTLIAHISKDGHHYIHPDISQLRSISVREAARIQSFPDDYYFEGVTEGNHQSPPFRQIGNAVPPIMADKIARTIKELLHG